MQRHRLSTVIGAKTPKAGMASLLLVLAATLPLACDVRVEEKPQGVEVQVRMHDDDRDKDMQKRLEAAAKQGFEQGYQVGKREGHDAGKRDGHRAAQQELEGRKWLYLGVGFLVGLLLSLVVIARRRKRTFAPQLARTIDRHLRFIRREAESGNPAVSSVVSEIELPLTAIQKQCADSLKRWKELGADDDWTKREARQQIEGRLEDVLSWLEDLRARLIHLSHTASDDLDGAKSEVQEAVTRMQQALEEVSK